MSSERIHSWQTKRSENGTTEKKNKKKVRGKKKEGEHRTGKSNKSK